MGRPWPCVFLCFMVVREREKDFHKVSRLTRNAAVPYPAIELKEKRSEKMINEDDEMN